MKKIILVLLSILLILSSVSCDNPEIGTSVTSGDITPPGDSIVLAPADKIIASIDGIDIPVYALRYFFVSAYKDFYEKNYSNISNFFNPNLPLHEQVPAHADYKEYPTWYDYFLSIAKRDLEYYIAFAVNAEKDGVSLTDEEKADIDKTVDEMEENAKSYEVSFSKYMEEFEMMGPGVTPETVKEVYYIFQLATKYSKIKYDSFAVTSDDIQKEFEKDKNTYSTVDYNIITIVPKYDATSTDEEKENAKKKAVEDADKFTSFIEAGSSFFDAHKLTYPELSDEAHTEFLNSYEVTKAEYVKEDTLSEWLFDEARVTGDINRTVDTQGKIKIAQIVKAANKNDDPLLNIRYIYIDLSLQHYNEVTAPQLAKDIIDEIKKADDKDKRFAELVALHSNDTTTNKKGGLIENVTPESTMLPEDIISWCFEDGRELYDCDYKEYTSYGVVCGYFITFISSHGRPYYEYMIEIKLKSDMLTNYIDDITNSISIEYDSSLSDLIYK